MCSNQVYPGLRTEERTAVVDGGKGDQLCLWTCFCSAWITTNQFIRALAVQQREKIEIGRSFKFAYI